MRYEKREKGRVKFFIEKKFDLQEKEIFYG